MVVVNRNFDEKNINNASLAFYYILFVGCINNFSNFHLRIKILLQQSRSARSSIHAIWTLPFVLIYITITCRLINPVVVAPTVAAVGLAFFSYGFPQAGSCVEISIPHIVLLLIFALVSDFQLI